MILVCRLLGFFFFFLLTPLIWLSERYLDYMLEADAPEWTEPDLAEYLSSSPSKISVSLN